MPTVLDSNIPYPVCGRRARSKSARANRRRLYLTCWISVRYFAVLSAILDVGSNTCPLRLYVYTRFSIAAVDALQGHSPFLHKDERESPRVEFPT